MSFTSTPQPAFQNVALDAIRAHRDLQRPINEAHVKRIMRSWNSDAFGAPLVAPRTDKPGHFWIVSGQHRLEAARRLGMTHVSCLVMTANSEEAMARAYIDEQTQRQQHPLVKHRIALAARDATAIGVQDTCDDLGYRIPAAGNGVSKGSATGVIQSMKPAYMLYDRGALKDVLRIIDSAFDKHYLACQGWMLGSLGTFLLWVERCEKTGFKFDEASFVASLRRAGITDVYNRFVARKSLDSTVCNNIGASVLVDIYNARRRVNRMPMVEYDKLRHAA